jgi:hypothetical protein
VKSEGWLFFCVMLLLAAVACSNPEPAPAITQTPPPEQPPPNMPEPESTDIPVPRFEGKVPGLTLAAYRQAFMQEGSWGVLFKYASDEDLTRLVSLAKPPGTMTLENVSERYEVPDACLLIHGHALRGPVEVLIDEPNRQITFNGVPLNLDKSPYPSQTEDVSQAVTALNTAIHDRLGALNEHPKRAATREFFRRLRDELDQIPNVTVEKWTEHVKAGANRLSPPATVSIKNQLGRVGPECLWTEVPYAVIAYIHSDGTQSSTVLTLSTHPTFAALIRQCPAPSHAELRAKKLDRNFHFAVSAVEQAIKLSITLQAVTTSEHFNKFPHACRGLDELDDIVRDATSSSREKRFRIVRTGELGGSIVDRLRIMNVNLPGPR